MLAPGACGGDRPPPADAPEGVEAPPAGEAPAPAGGGASAPRPDTVTDTLLVEGMPERMRLRLMRAPEGFPLPFSAYVPVDMEMAERPPGEDPAVRFVAAFGGVRNDDAFLEIVAHPPGLDAAAAREHARRGAGVPAGAEPLEATGFDWADQGWRWSAGRGNGGFAALLIVGRARGRSFHVLRRYPPEYGDGFAPRAGLLLESLRFTEPPGG